MSLSTGKYFLKMPGLLRRSRSALQDSSMKQYYCSRKAGSKFLADADFLFDNTSTTAADIKNITRNTPYIRVKVYCLLGFSLC
jgi:hypothetical protein